VLLRTFVALGFAELRTVKAEGEDEQRGRPYDIYIDGERDSKDEIIGNEGEGQGAAVDGEGVMLSLLQMEGTRKDM